MKQLSVAKGLDHVEVLAQLTAAIILENDRPEHKYLAGEALAWGQILKAAAGAGVTGFGGLRNPTGSGKIVVLEGWRGILGTGAVTGRLYYGIVRGATLTQANTEQPRDTRLQPTGVFGTAAPNIAGQIVSGQSDTIVATPFALGEFVYTLSAGAAMAFASQQDIPAVLAPGDTFLIWPSDGAGGNTANLAVQFSGWWRERTTEPTET